MLIKITYQIYVLTRFQTSQLMSVMKQLYLSLIAQNILSIKVTYAKSPYAYHDVIPFCFAACC